MQTVLEKYRSYLMKLLPARPALSPLEAPGRGTKTRQRLDSIGQVFMQGCWLALDADTLEELALQLNKVNPELQGFAFEGAGMGLTIIDHITHWKMKCLQSFAVGAGVSHLFMLYVGAGLALARLRQPVEGLLARLDPVSGWFAVDGYGFHEGFFRYRYVYPEVLSGYALRVFDQGLGRSIWFRYAGESDQMATAIAAFEPSRQNDLWGGIGLACAYAGIVDRSVLEQIRLQAGSSVSYIAQGVAIAAKIRQSAGNMAQHTELASQVFCNTSGEGAANATYLALEDLSSTGADSAYEVWRQRIRMCFV